MIEVIHGVTRHQHEAARLAAIAATLQDQGVLYLGFPVLNTPDGPLNIDALLLSHNHGIVIFALFPGTVPSDYLDILDDVANKLESRLRSFKALMRRRDLVVKISTLAFTTAPRHGWPSPKESITDSENLLASLPHIDNSESQHIESVLGIVQSTANIRNPRVPRNIQNDNSRGAVLNRIEQMLSTLDDRQDRAVIETFDGVQRIRGLAGTGKTIVLALKAAYLYTMNPHWTICVTFNSRALKSQFRNLIRAFVYDKLGLEPDWNRIQVLHAWGAPGGDDNDGVYFRFCGTYGIEYHNFGQARRLFREGHEFAGACDSALVAFSGGEPLFDAILIDEAQDLPTSFVRLCYQALGSGKRLVYAYDELQHLGLESLLPPEELFGESETGIPKVTFDPPETGQASQDIILKKCYRNPRSILVSAHALGFGIYRDPPSGESTGLVQIFDQARLWEDVGYQVRAGSLHDNSNVTLGRDNDASPAYLEEESLPDDIVMFRAFPDRAAQAQWIATEIQELIREQELRPDDIMVINPTHRATSKVVGPLQALLFQLGIPSHIVGVTSSKDVFTDPDQRSIPFTGIYRAKGNEAAMVYVMDAEACFSAEFDLAELRSRLFTAMTRAKAWLRVTGTGEAMELLVAEWNKVKSAQFQLEFRYPNQAERDRLKLINRERSPESKLRARVARNEVDKLLADLESSKLLIDDLSQNQRERLKQWLNPDAT